VLAVEVGPGDLLSVPRGTQHWFDLCSDRRIRAVRLFQDPGGWTPHYTGSGIDAAHLPVCLGPSLPPAASAHRASEQPRAIVLDVEGTTTPIAFVHQRLFAYAAAHLPVFLAAHGEDERIAEHIDELRGQWHEDASSDAAMPAWSDDSFDERMASAARYCAWLSARDRKSTALKALQGYVWRTGYESGELRGEVYEDVPPALAAWRAGGRTVAIYSSGSVLAQRLLFQYAAAGDLTSLISSFFDTRIGAKTEPASYLRLAARLGFPAAQLAFVSDNRHELEAARAAGVIAVACVRPGMRQDDILGHPVVRHLGEVDGVVAGTTTAGKELSPVSPVRVRAEQAAG
jgi:enolase-phosphatase E1